MAVLFSSSVRSMCQLERAVKNSITGRRQYCMQYLNLGFFALLFGLQILYLMLWNSSEHWRTIVTVSLLKCWVYFCEQVVFMFLVAQFSTNIRMKSCEQANGDLLIVGISDDGQEQFAFLLKSTVNALHESRQMQSSCQDTATSYEDYDVLWRKDSLPGDLQWKNLDDRQTEELAIASSLVMLNSQKRNSQNIKAKL